MKQIILTVDTDEQAKALLDVLDEAEGDALDFSFNTEVRNGDEA